MGPLPVVVRAGAATEQREPAFDPVPGYPFGSRLRERREGLLEPPVALGAPLEPDVGANLRERPPDRAPLRGQVRAREKEDVLGPAREASVPGEDHPPLRPRLVEDLIVR